MVVGVIVLVDVCIGVPVIIAGHVGNDPILTTDDNPRLNVSKNNNEKNDSQVQIVIYFLLLLRVWVFWNRLPSISMNAGAKTYFMFLLDLPSCIS